MIGDEQKLPDLPQSWTSITVDEACPNIATPNKVKQRDYHTEGALAVVDQGSALIGGYTDDAHLAVDTQLPVIVFGDHTRALKYIEFPFAAGADGIKVLRPSGYHEPRLLYRLLQAIRLPEKGYARHYQYLRKSRVPVPPAAEQRRIISKLENALGRLEECRTRLSHVRRILKRFREAVVEAALTGRLTEEWRKSLGAETGYVAFASGSNPFSDYNVPSSWGKKMLSEIAEINGGITKDSKKQNPSFEELPYLRVANVQRGRLDLAEMKNIRVPADRVADLLLAFGDILFTEGGDLDKLGRGWVWEGQIRRCVFQNHVFRARLHDTDFAPKFFSHFANSRGFQYFLTFGKQTTNLASINKSVLSSLPVPIPTSGEQREIVRRVDELYAMADLLEGQCQSASLRADNLTPAMLAKAFRGELVRQDPADEPAALLVKRISEGRSTTENIGRDNKQRGPKARSQQREVRKDMRPLRDVLQEAGDWLPADEAFRRCGVLNGTATDEMEGVYAQLRELDKAGELVSEPTRDRRGRKLQDRLRLKSAS